MAEAELIKRMADEDIHRKVNPQYINKLEKIQEQKGIRFISAEEFETYFSD
jgi:hypothetical protein